MSITVTRGFAPVEPASGPIRADLRTSRLWAGGAAGAARLGILTLSFAATPALDTTTTLLGQVFKYVATPGDSQGDVERGATFSLPNVAQEANALAFAERLAEAIRRHEALEAEVQVRILGIVSGTGSNLLTAGDNGTFEANATGWAGGTRINTDSQSGAWSYERSGVSVITAANAVSVVSGTTYRVRLFAKLLTADDMTVRLGAASADVTPQLVVGQWSVVEADLVATTTGLVNVEVQPGGPSVVRIDNVTVAALVPSGRVGIRIEGRRLGLALSHAGQGFATIVNSSAGAPRTDYELIGRVDVESTTVPGGYEPLAELNVAVKPIAPADPNDPDSANLAPYEADATLFVDAIARAHVGPQFIPLKERNPKILDRAARAFRVLYGDRYLEGSGLVRSRLNDAGLSPFVVLNTDFDDTTHLLRTERRTSAISQTSCATITGQGDTLKPYCYPDGLPKWLTWSPNRAHVRGAPLFASIYSPATGTSLENSTLRWQGVRESDGATISGLIDIDSLVLRFPAACDTGLTERVVLFQLDRLIQSQIAECTSMSVRIVDKTGETARSEDFSFEIQDGCGDYVLLKYLNDFGVPEILVCPSPVRVEQRMERVLYEKPAKRLGTEQQDRRSRGIADARQTWAYTISSLSTGILEAQRWAELARSREVELIVRWEDAIPATLPALVEDEEVAYLDTSADQQFVELVLLVEGQVLANSDVVSIAQPLNNVGGGGVSEARVQELIDASLDALTAADIPFTPTGNIVATNVQGAIAELELDKNARIDQMGMPIATNIVELDGVNDEFTWARAAAALPTEFTVTGWVKLAASSGNRILFSTNVSGSGADQLVVAASLSGSGTAWILARYTAAGTLISGIGVSPGDQPQVAVPGIGEWTHFAARIRTAATTSADLWINGQLYGRGGTGFTSPTNYGANAGLFFAPGASARVNGFASNFTFHNRLLTRDEIMALARRGRAFVLPTGAVAHWTFDGSLTADATGNGNTLTALGGVGLVTMH